MTRREVFEAAALLAVLPEKAGPSVPEETLCMRIFRLWEAERAWVFSPEVQAMSEDDFDQEVAQLTALDVAMQAANAESARDFILKVIVISEYGTCGIPMRSACPEFWNEAEALVESPSYGAVRFEA